MFRKIFSPEECDRIVALHTSLGGGPEIFYGETLKNQVDVNMGDLLVFPSFVTHRASEVQNGTRWSLVFWFCGSEPLK
jgi:predicted 2-oxoglutarate/Fe(II)-dependent dioxygenase YbiX